MPQLVCCRWIRDSAVQLGSLMPRMTRRPALRMLVEGAVRTQVGREGQQRDAPACLHPSAHTPCLCARMHSGAQSASCWHCAVTPGAALSPLALPSHRPQHTCTLWARVLQAFMIIQDPYANAYLLKWTHPNAFDKFSRMLGRGGWVATRNYELVRGRRAGRACGQAGRQGVRAGQAALAACMPAWGTGQPAQAVSGSGCCTNACCSAARSQQCCGHAPCKRHLP